MRKKPAHMFRGFVFILAIAVILYGLLISCTPQGRMNRNLQEREKLKKLYPGLVTHDTTFENKVFNIPGVEGSVSIDEDLKPDPKIDSLLNLLADCPGKKDSNQTAIKDTLRNEIKKEIAYDLQKEIKDTTITKDGVIVKITSKGGKLNIDIKTPDRKVTEKIPVEENIFQPKEKVGFWAGVWIYIKDFFAWSGIIFWIILIVAVLWKIFKPKL